MADKSTVSLLQKAIAEIKDCIDTCLQEDIPVICINKETRKKKLIRFEVLYENNKQFWLQNKTWEYFLSSDDYLKLQEKANEQMPSWVLKTSNNMPHRPEDDVNLGFGKDYEPIAHMEDSERVQHIKENKERLDRLIITKPRQENVITEALVETAKDTVLHNHAALMNVMNLSNEDAKAQTQGIVDSTHDFVKASSQLISSNIFDDELMNTLVSKSDGTIIQHMIRVYLNGLAFLSYYNKMVSSSSMINKMRVSFDETYQRFYHGLLPHIHPDHFTLEKVFHGGMRTISESNFYSWATGFLIHDLGKAAAVEYHEGEAEYNRDIVIEHVKVGYTSIINKTNYPREAGLVTGYHHEYYGDPAGYGYFRSYLNQYKKANPTAKHNSCIAYDLKPMMDHEALGYFPAKVLEIIDVFDSVTDPNRKYRKAMTTEEALKMMVEEFIFKHPKLDLVLFEIFAKFVRETKLNNSQ